MDNEKLIAQTQQLLFEFQEKAQLQPNNLFVVGGSTSEISGNKIGSASSIDVAGAIIPVLMQFAQENKLFLSVQCCEHLNRALVVEKKCVDFYHLEEVHVVPYEKAGGSMGAKAMALFQEPVVVESLKGQAHGGIDIGDTFIGMHMRRVVVPIRVSIKEIGRAHVTLAKTRPMLIGGERARYK